ncbi:hypothetical protein EDM52_22565 [Brevibacillus invocatus]|uniref:Type I restriction enzyme R protein N-terminal domain-containing protein n=1 Tax=Brevibacillus invocatus TaxID=173959 RepID=A0A3M8BW17_9BACL|nr:hypothetical protein [Brevibacillus invocatus]RNB67534.1 hypothetical protein EDM52_22565 [Brevibacillus invocatus]
MPNISERNLLNNIINEILLPKGFSHSAILQDVSISMESAKRMYVDLILINEKTKNYLAIIEVKSRLHNENLRSAQQQVQLYLKALNNPALHGYVMGVDQNSNFVIYSFNNKMNTWEVISIDNFPNYYSLTTVDEKQLEITKTKKRKKNVDTFLLICIIAAIITCAFLILSLCNVLKLEDREMSLLLLTIGLVIIPFVAKLEILGIVFERKAEK